MNLFPDEKQIVLPKRRNESETEKQIDDPYNPREETPKVKKPKTGPMTHSEYVALINTGNPLAIYGSAENVPYRAPTHDGTHDREWIERNAKRKENRRRYLERRDKKYRLKHGRERLK